MIGSKIHIISHNAYRPAKQTPLCFTAGIIILYLLSF